MVKKLKIGFIVISDYIPVWYAETISALLKDTQYRFYFFKLSGKSFEKASLPFVYRLFLKFEGHWFKPAYDALKPVALKELLQGNPVFGSSIIQSYVLDAGSLNELKKFELDILYTNDFNISTKENLSEASKYGLWYVHFGYEKYKDSHLPAFWEVMDNSPVTGSYLLMRKNSTDFILYEGTTTSVPFSVKNNFNSIAFKSSSYALHRIKSLEHFSDRFLNFYTNKFYKGEVKRQAPSNLKMISLFTKNVTAYLSYKIKIKLNKRRFTLLYSFSSFNLETINRTKFTSVSLPPDCFLADPFVIAKDSKHYIFFEEYVYSKGKGHISLIQMDENNKPSESMRVLEKSYHLSYPYVFSVNEDYYMIPETSENKTVELYKALAFPHKWEKIINLFEDKSLIDCSVIFRDGLWWLFATASNHQVAFTNDQLFLYYSNSLVSTDWKPHPQNPVATHAENCRPAGRIFEIDGTLYRPSQNNASQQYGFGVNFNKIEILNPEEYRERKVATIDPHALGLIAVHNIDFSSKFIVIDGIVG